MDFGTTSKYDRTLVLRSLIKYDRTIVPAAGTWYDRIIREMVHMLIRGTSMHTI